MISEKEKWYRVTYKEKPGMEFWVSQETIGPSFA